MAGEDWCIVRLFRRRAGAKSTACSTLHRRIIGQTSRFDLPCRRTAGPRNAADPRLAR